LNNVGNTRSPSGAGETGLNPHFHSTHAEEKEEEEEEERRI